MLKRCLAFLLVMVMLTASVAFISADAASDGDISPAIRVLKNSTGFFKAGVKGRAQTFSRAEFEALIGSEVKFITVTSLPESGGLKLGGIPVMSGQTVAGASLDFLTYTGDKDKASSFTFRCGAEGWESTDIKCELCFRESENGAPSVTAGTLPTVKGAMTEYEIPVTDPDGDAVSITVAEYPANGSLKLSGKTLYYSPKDGFSGKDTVKLRARDKFGAVSAEITLNVVVSDTDLVFADMTDRAAHAAAISLAEKDIVSYVCTDGKYLFDPDGRVSRIDFLVMLMTAAKIPVGESGNVPFSDSDKLTDGRRRYLAKAVELEIVSPAARFRPNDTLTRGDAALWIAKVFGFEGSVAVFADTAAVTPEMSASIDAVTDLGVIRVSDGMFRPSMAVTRESAALMIFRALAKQS